MAYIGREMNEGPPVVALAGNPLGWDLADFGRWAAGLGEAPYRARQAAAWLFGRGVTDPAAMTDLPSSLRRSLAGECAPLLPAVDRRLDSADGTAKFLLALADGEPVEMVLIPEGRRTTLCFSTQAGCPVGCLFCRTGQGGLRRNLTAAEMAGQVLLARSLAPGGKLTNLVVMGMGEPLLNFDAVCRMLETVTAPWGMGIPSRRITLSTSGAVPLLKPLRERFPALNLAVSLNAPDDDLRRRLMPGAARRRIAEILAEVRSIPGRSRHPVTLEYVLLGGVNDTPAQAARLATLLRGDDLPVNLIPWNAVPDADFAPPTPEGVRRFREILEGRGLTVRLRKSRGADVQAACGQLRHSSPRGTPPDSTGG